MAIPLVVVILGVIFVLFAASHAGLWAWLLVGAVGIVVCALLLARAAKKHRHPPASDAPPALSPSADGSIHRVLVVAGGTATSQRPARGDR